jgi:hypothetical protein
MEPIKEGDLGKLCLRNDILVDSCIGKPSALNVTSNFTAIPFHWISPDWTHHPDSWEQYVTMHEQSVDSKQHVLDYVDSIIQ